jgi:hypothetical protein
MTEAEWLACEDPWRMLYLLLSRGGGRRLSSRVLRLFACACCRAACPRGIGPEKEARFAAAEAFADGKVTAGEVRGLWGHEGRQSPPEEPVEWCVGLARTRTERQKPLRAALLRCVIGSLVPPIAPGRPRPDPTARSLAKAAYQERRMLSGHLDPARLAVLSDALEEAGCTDAEILSHLRSPGPHVRGCWALDLILGKS